MKRCFAVITVLLIIAVLSNACTETTHSAGSSSDEPESGSDTPVSRMALKETYIEKNDALDGHVSFKYPEGWKVEEFLEKDISRVNFTGPSADIGFYFHHRAQDIFVSCTKENFLSRICRDTDDLVLTEFTRTTVGGLGADKAVFNYTQNGFRIIETCYINIAFSKNAFYTVFFNCSEESYSKYKDIIDDIASSIVFFE